LPTTGKKKATAHDWTEGKRGQDVTAGCTKHIGDTCEVPGSGEEGLLHIGAI